jgi:hypothetical protein
LFREAITPVQQMIFLRDFLVVLVGLVVDLVVGVEDQFRVKISSPFSTIAFFFFFHHTFLSQ